MEILKEQILNTEDKKIKTVGHILQEIAKTSTLAAELIEQDLTIAEMSIENCYNAIYSYAKKNKTGNVFACSVFGIDPDNTIIKIILDFYKIPKGWLNGEQPKVIDKPKKQNLLDLL